VISKIKKKKKKKKKKKIKAHQLKNIHILIWPGKKAEIQITSGNIN
jgi:hypothetical protein